LAAKMSRWETPIVPFRGAFWVSSGRCRIGQGIFSESIDFRRIFRIVVTVTTTSFSPWPGHRFP
jgi:hypothetical protein